MRALFTLPIVVVALILAPVSALAQFAYLDHDQDGEVVGVTYQGNAKWLVEQKDPESHFHKSKRLESFRLLNYAVSHEEMAYVARLTNVKDLEVGAGPESLAIEARSFALVGKMTQLESLSFCKDNLTDADLKPLANLNRLSNLGIDNMERSFPGDRERVTNQGLTDAAADQIAALTSLERLRIHGTHKLTDMTMEKLASLPKLERLDVAGDFTDKALQILGSEYRLRELAITSPESTDDGIQALSRARDLEEVVILSTKVSAKSIAHLRSLPKLRLLELSIERVEPDTVDILAGMKSLETLRLRQIPFSDADLAKLKDHPKLNTLFLENAKLTEQSLEVFKSMKNLEYVNLGWDAKESKLQIAINEHIAAKKAK